MENDAGVAIDVDLGRNRSEQDIARRFERVARYLNELSDNLQGYPIAIDARYRDAFAVKLPDEQSSQAWRESRRQSES